MINLDFNNVADPVVINKEPIPHNTVARAICKIKLNPNPIPSDDPAVFKTPNTGSIYTEFEWTIIDGQYAGRKFWDQMFWTEKTEKRTMGMILRIIEDNYALNSKDDSPEVQACRQLKSLSDIDGFEACVIIALNKGQINKQTGENYPDKNALLTVLNNAGKDYIQRKSPPKPMPAVKHIPQPPSIEGADVYPNLPNHNADEFDDEIPI